MAKAPKSRKPLKTLVASLHSLNKRSPAPTPLPLKKTEKISRSALLCLYRRLLCGWVISGHFFDFPNFPLNFLHFLPASPQTAAPVLLVKFWKRSQERRKTRGVTS
ncbi:hypothetical protein SLE2022_136070 [Rubroshorea leprosula]